MLGGPGWRSGRSHMLHRVNPEEYEKWLAGAASEIAVARSLAKPVSAYEKWLAGAAREMVEWFNGVPDFDDAMHYLKTTWEPVPDADEVAAILQTAYHVKSVSDATVGKVGVEFLERLGGRFAHEDEAAVEEVVEYKPKRMSAKAKYESWIDEAAQDAYEWFGRGDHAVTGEKLAEYLTSVWKPRPRKTEMRAIADRMGELVRLRLKSIAGPQEQYMFEPGGLYGPEAVEPWGKRLFPRGKVKSKRAKKNPASPKYYVKARSSKEEGLKGWVRGPYELAVAKEYARIGSQEGRDRSVLRGQGGPVVRRYSHGKRVWPKTSSQLKGLLHKEHPREL